jgi:hypothetical protein
MSFSWTSITAGTTKITAAQMNEVKTNVDHLTTQLGVSAYSWSTLPVTQYNKANAANVTELQTAITYVDNLNVCATYNAAVNSGVLTGDDNSIHTGKDASILSGQDASIHTGKDVTIWGNHYSSYWGGHDTTINGSQNSGALGSQNTSYRGANWSSAENGAFMVYCGAN